MKCPLCKHAELKKFSGTATEKKMVCENCEKIIEVETKFGKVVKVVVPGGSILTSAILILNFFGVENADELFDSIDDMF